MNQNYAKSFKPDNRFHKISVVGGGLTGAFITLLLKKSNLFDDKEIAWIKPKADIDNDFRTSFYNNKNIDLLKKLNVLQDIPDNDITLVKQIHVFSQNQVSPLIWESSDEDNQLGAIIKNNTVLNILNKKLLDVLQYNGFVTNTQFNDFERILYLKDKTCIKTHLVLSADGKNSNLRKLSSIKVITKKNNHIAISGFFTSVKET
jgi:2-polyprenyl-6-methoxyphenol hydroxylase-like FAD-dependent oxidoreductase